MIEFISVPPLVQGLLVVSLIILLSVTLYVGYARIEAALSDRLFGQFKPR